VQFIFVERQKSWRKDLYRQAGCGLDAGRGVHDAPGDLPQVDPPIKIESCRVRDGKKDVHHPSPNDARRKGRVGIYDYGATSRTSSNYDIPIDPEETTYTAFGAGPRGALGGPGGRRLRLRERSRDEQFDGHRGTIQQTSRSRGPSVFVSRTSRAFSFRGPPPPAAERPVSTQGKVASPLFGAARRKRRSSKRHCEPPGPGGETLPGGDKSRPNLITYPSKHVG